MPAMSNKASSAVFVAVLAFAYGCATIRDGKTASVLLQSTPTNAVASVYDSDGVKVAETTTPGRVELKRRGKWLRPARYTASFQKSGYQTENFPIESTVNPWIVGNVALGGVVGLGVDAATGAMWRPKHSTIEQPLVAEVYADASDTAVQPATHTSPAPAH